MAHASTSLGGDTYVAADVPCSITGDGATAAALERARRGRRRMDGGRRASGRGRAPRDAIVELVVGRRRVRPRDGVRLRQDVLTEQEVTCVRRRHGDLAAADHVRPRVHARPRRGGRRRRRAGARYRLDPEQLLDLPGPAGQPAGRPADRGRRRGRRRPGRVAAGDPRPAPHAPRRADPDSAAPGLRRVGRLRRSPGLRVGGLQARRSSTRATTTAPIACSGSATPLAPPTSRRAAGRSSRSRRTTCSSNPGEFVRRTWAAVDARRASSRHAHADHGRVVHLRVRHRVDEALVISGTWRGRSTRWRSRARCAPSTAELRA